AATRKQASDYASSLQSDLNKTREKLRKLNEFDRQSSTIVSNISALEGALKSGTAQVVADFNGFCATTGFRSYQSSDLPWATELKDTWKKRQVVMEALKTQEDMTEEEAKAITDYYGVTGEYEKEIIFYDNYFGYGKSKISVSASTDSDVAIKFDKGVFSGIGLGESASISKDGSTEGTLKGSALSSDSLTPSSTGKVGPEEAGISFTLEKDNTSLTMGYKYVNGVMASYASKKTTVNNAVEVSTDKEVKTDVSVETEYGKYQRNNDDGSYYDLAGATVNVVSGVVSSGVETAKEVGTFVWDNIGTIAVGTVIIGGTALAAIYLSPYIAVGWLVSSAVATFSVNSGENDGEK
ncbi:hypothetical protein, partial [Streptococcus loxodontisalivarius]